MVEHLFIVLRKLDQLNVLRFYLNKMQIRQQQIITDIHHSTRQASSDKKMLRASLFNLVLVDKLALYVVISFKRSKRKIGKNNLSRTS